MSGSLKKQTFARSANLNGCRDRSGQPKAGVAIPKKRGVYTAVFGEKEKKIWQNQQDIV